MNSKLCFGAALFLGLVTTTQASELLQNGNFETGSTLGWTLGNGGSGSFVITPVGGTPPISANADGPFLTAANPAGGSFFIVSDMAAPGKHVLYQPFEIPSPGGSTQLHFQMFENNYGDGLFVNPAGLDENASPNQHTRIDIMAPGAMGLDPFDTGAGVLKNLHFGAPPTTQQNPNPYSDYSFDISDVAATPGVYVLRFGEVDNRYDFNMGIDNVSIQFSAVPEPSSLALALLAGTLVLASRRFLKTSQGGKR